MVPSFTSSSDLSWQAEDLLECAPTLERTEWETPDDTSGIIALIGPLIIPPLITPTSLHISFDVYGSSHYLPHAGIALVQGNRRLQHIDMGRQEEWEERATFGGAIAEWGGGGAWVEGDMSIEVIIDSEDGEFTIGCVAVEVEYEEVPATTWISVVPQHAVWSYWVEPRIDTDTYGFDKDCFVPGSGATWCQSADPAVVATWPTAQGPTMGRCSDTEAFWCNSDASWFSPGPLPEPNWTAALNAGGTQCSPNSNVAATACPWTTYFRHDVNVSLGSCQPIALDYNVWGDDEVLAGLNPGTTTWGYGRQGADPDSSVWLDSRWHLFGGTVAPNSNTFDTEEGTPAFVLQQGLAPADVLSQFNPNGNNAFIGVARQASHADLRYAKDVMFGATASVLVDCATTGCCSVPQCAAYCAGVPTPAPTVPSVPPTPTPTIPPATAAPTLAPTAASTLASTASSTSTRAATYSAGGVGEPGVVSLKGDQSDSATEDDTLAVVLGVVLLCLIGLTFNMILAHYLRKRVHRMRREVEARQRAHAAATPSQARKTSTQAYASTQDLLRQMHA